MDLEKSIDDVLPALEELDQQVETHKDNLTDPEQIHTLAENIADTHNITTDELLDHYTLTLILTSNDDESHIQELKTYLTETRDISLSQ